ncbi:MAG: hypothetical protein RBJ76_13285 [Stenomitos frigidus ULC029]
MTYSESGSVRFQLNPVHEANCDAFEQQGYDDRMNGVTKIPSRYCRSVLDTSKSYIRGWKRAHALLQAS